MFPIITIYSTVQSSDSENIDMTPDVHPLFIEIIKNSFWYVSILKIIFSQPLEIENFFRGFIEIHLVETSLFYTITPFT